MSWAVQELGMANFPNHSPPQVGHVPLREPESFLPSGQGFQELACEHAAVITILLLWCVLRIVILPPSEVKRFLSLVSVFRVQITSQGLEGQYKDLPGHAKAS